MKAFGSCLLWISCGIECGVTPASWDSCRTPAAGMGFSCPALSEAQAPCKEHMMLCRAMQPARRLPDEQHLLLHGRLQDMCPQRRDHHQRQRRLRDVRVPE